VEKINSENNCTRIVLFEIIFTPARNCLSTSS